MYTLLATYEYEHLIFDYSKFPVFSFVFFFDKFIITWNYLFVGDVVSIFVRLDLTLWWYFNEFPVRHVRVRKNTCHTICTILSTLGLLWSYGNSLYSSHVKKEYKLYNDR